MAPQSVTRWSYAVYHWQPDSLQRAAWSDDRLVRALYERLDRLETARPQAV
ncbi:hypothetical protein RKD32_006623 [Streptomyces sp. SAI-195]|uniref:hypothetical protein n=1 Tax=unclassified Streptomyces TaxID=2593676 RepID=UPI003430F272